MAENEKNIMENEESVSHSVSHHSHSHSSHHKHHTANNHKKNKFQKFLKKNKKKLLMIFAIVCAVGILVALGLLVDINNRFDKSDSDKNVTNATSRTIQLEIPYFTDEVCLVSPAVETFASPNNVYSGKQIYDKMIGDSERLDVGLPVNLSFRVNGMPSGCVVAASVIEISETKDFNSPLVIELGEGETSAEIYFLKTGVKYNYRIRITVSDGQEISAQGSFITANTPRILSIDGIVNVRDIGGWETENGKKIRQGLLIRGSELDAAVENKYSITPKGLDDMLNVLKIKSDFDLRAVTDNKTGTDALGANVEHIYFSVPMYSQIFAPEAKENVRRLFSELADESNYPVYLHCTYGADRTGTVCYLLEAVLGMSEKNLLREYELTAMHHGSINSQEMDRFIESLKKLEGETMQAKAEGFLLNSGVTAEEIDNIRRIFLED